MCGPNATMAPLPPHAFGQGSSFARRLGFMKHIRNNPEGRLAAITLQIDSLQARLCGTRMIDGRREALGPIERSFLEIEIAELRIEYAGVVSKLPM